MGRLDALYAHLPVPLQNAAVTSYGAYWHWLRFGPGYGQELREFQLRERFGRAEWERWQSSAVQALLHAALATPYYREAWSAAERRAAIAGQLQELPLLEKEALRAAPWSFVREGGRSGRCHVFHTSGTTGTPIATVWTAHEVRRSQALREARSALWAGTSFRFPRATFSGRLAVPNAESRGPFHRYNRVERQVYLSPFHLREETAPLYVAALQRHGTEWLTGYAVSYYILARFILEQRLAVTPLRAVVTTSEKVTPSMRAAMTEAYGCPVFEEYSTVENALFASECERGRLHVSPDAGLVEILRPDGSAAEPGEAGEVVATCLLRTLQPLVRYRLGDQAVWDDEPCACGRGMPVIREVLGRVEDVVLGADGRRLVRFHGLFVDQPHVRAGQVVQERLDRIRVNILPADGFGEADAREIARRIRQRLGPDMEILVTPVAELPRTASGKFQPVVSLLREAGVPAAERTGLA